LLLKGTGQKGYRKLIFFREPRGDGHRGLKRV
jgi:hypothetical protein